MMMLAGTILGIDWQQILLHVFNFIILAAGLTFILFKPVRKFMQYDGKKQNRHYDKQIHNGILLKYHAFGQEVYGKSLFCKSKKFAAANKIIGASGGYAGVTASIPVKTAISPVKIASIPVDAGLGERRKYYPDLWQNPWTFANSMR